MHPFDVFNRVSRCLRKDIRDVNFVVVLKRRAVVVITSWSSYSSSVIEKVVSVVIITSGLKLIFKRGVIFRV